MVREIFSSLRASSSNAKRTGGCMPPASSALLDGGSEERLWLIPHSICILGEVNRGDISNENAAYPVPFSPCCRHRTGRPAFLANPRRVAAQGHRGNS